MIKGRSGPDPLEHGFQKHKLRGSGTDGEITASTAHFAASLRLESAFIQAVLWIAVCGYAVFAVLSLFGSPVGAFDDAIPLVGGMQVRRGLTPGQDFYSVYPPLGLYVNAFAFGLLGRTVIATRVIDAVLYLLLLLLASRLLRRRFSYSLPLIPVATLLFAAGIGGAISLPPWQGFAISLAGFLIYLYPVNSKRSRLLAVAASGALTGIALLYRVNFGGYVAAAVIIDLLLPRKARYGRLRFEPDFKLMGAFGIPIVVCCSGFYFLVYGTNAATMVPNILAAGGHAISVRFITLGVSGHLFFALMFPCLWFCAQILRNADDLPGSALVAAAFAFALPVMAMAGRNRAFIPYILVAAELASVIFLHFFARRQEKFDLAVLLFYCCVLHYYLARSDSQHWAVVPIAMALLLPSLVLRGDAVIELPSEPAVHRGPAIALLGTAIFVIAEMTSIQPATWQARTGIRILASVGHIAGKSDTDLAVDAPPPTPEWAAVYPDENELQAVRYLRARSTSADSIFVGLADHSKILVNDLRIYWLADRPIGVRTFQLETRMATEAVVQREIVLDLQRNHVKWLVIDLAEQHGDRTFERRAYRGSGLLDAYIRGNFRPEARFGQYAVLAAR